MSFSRILSSTISKYLRKEEVNILRKRKLLAALSKKGRLTYNDSGEQLEWYVRYKRAPLIQYADAEQLTFPRRDKRKKPTLGWRAYAATDSMTKMERLQNRGAEAIIKLYSNLTKELLEDIREHFCEELYIDGNAAANTKRIHGLNSFFGCSGNGNGTTQPAFLGATNDTYAGFTTGLGDYGGTWTGVWPAGTGDTHYDWWTPTVVDLVHTGWTAATASFVANAVEGIRYGISAAQKNSEMLDLILLERDWYRQFQGLLDDKERINVERNRANSLMVSLGFGDVTNFDGVDITWEYGLPTARGFGLSLDQLELRSMQGQLFDSNAEDFDLAGLSHRFAVDFFGNMRCNPRSQVKFTDDPATT